MKLGFPWGNFKSLFSRPGKVECCVWVGKTCEIKYFILTLTFSLLDAALVCDRSAQHTYCIPSTCQVSLKKHISSLGKVGNKSQMLLIWKCNPVNDYISLPEHFNTLLPPCFQTFWHLHMCGCTRTENISWKWRAGNTFIFTTLWNLH